jgi:hypothetical protein
MLAVTGRNTVSGADTSLGQCDSRPGTSLALCVSRPSTCIYFYYMFPYKKMCDNMFNII